MGKFKLAAAVSFIAVLVGGTQSIIRGEQSVLPSTDGSAASSQPAAGPKADIQNAVRKLAAGDNYSWTATSNRGGSDDVVQGKTQNGIVALAVTYRNNNSSVLIRGDNALVNTVFGWQSAAVIIEATPNYGRTPNPNFYPAYLTKGYKAPAVVAAGLLDYLQNIQKTDNGYAADLAPDGAAQLLIHTRTYNLDRTALPKITEATGTIKFSLQDGKLIGFEAHASGISTFNTSSRAVDQRIAVQMMDVGSTTVDMPPEALEVFNALASQPSAQ